MYQGKEKECLESHKDLLCLDGDQDLFHSLLRTAKFLTKRKAKEFLKYTINLDSNLKLTIAPQREKLTTTGNQSDSKKVKQQNGVNTAVTSRKVSGDVVDSSRSTAVKVDIDIPPISQKEFCRQNRSFQDPTMRSAEQVLIDLHQPYKN